jgi:EAL domain-containing protein (putative c-di-GMP-specific phosphodiesterase class I)/GGDEF domain-containing protein
MMVVVVLLVHTTGGIKYVFSHTMYIPIILAAYFFHVPGGLLAGILGGLLLGPYMPLTVATGEMQDVTNWVYRMLIFMGIGSMLGIMFSVTEMGLKKIEWLANHAPDTGLPNLSYLIKSLEKITHEEEPDAQYALLAVRINNYAEITSIFGVAEMNELSVKYAEVIQVLTDKDGLIFHFYPQTYLVYRKIQTDEQEIQDLIEQNFNKLENPMAINDIPLFFNIGIGIAIEPVKNLIPSSFFMKAKLASMMAGEQDRKFSFYQHGAVEWTRNAQKILGDIPKAVKNDEFELFFQPIVAITSAQVMGVEALIRWHHKTLGELLPASFLPVSENTSLIFMIHNWVMKAAVQELSEWKAFRGRMSINLSTRSLLDQNWIDTFVELLQTYKVDPSRIIFEVTESSLIVDRQRSIDTLTRICGLGVKIAIDDFGTGYSSFEYIHMLPVDYLKIDRRFIVDGLTSVKSQEIVKSIIRLTKTLEIESIAEGVETIGQLDWLRSIHCDYVQGFLINRPQSCEHIQSWLNQNPVPNVGEKQIKSIN